MRKNFIGAGKFLGRRACEVFEYRVYVYIDLYVPVFSVSFIYFLDIGYNGFWGVAYLVGLQDCFGLTWALLFFFDRQATLPSPGFTFVLWKLCSSGKTALSCVLGLVIDTSVLFDKHCVHSSWQHQRSSENLLILSVATCALSFFLKVCAPALTRFYLPNTDFKCHDCSRQV